MLLRCYLAALFGFRAGRNLQDLARLDQIGIRNLVAIGVEDFVPAIRASVEFLGDLRERVALVDRVGLRGASTVGAVDATPDCTLPKSAFGAGGAVDEAPLCTFEKSGFLASPMSALLCRCRTVNNTPRALNGV